MVNLIQKSLPKVVKIPEQHLIFVNIGVKNFTVRNDPKDPMVTSLIFYIQFFAKIGFSNYKQNCLVLSKNRKEF
jgi:hypothetical protein